MAEESDERDARGELNPRVWTFNISGGPPFQIMLPDNPRLDYKGGREIWKIATVKSTADAVLAMMKSLGVAVTCSTEGETPEQTAERRRNLGLDS